ncbi:MAG: Lrp/AsnC family transcriptional regulator [Candidatus Bathyarchaeota archaeon]|jgi:Lrp/AsnC family transcriptional regulator for asnA, asnC and gidA
MVELDTVDIRILEILQNSARTPYSAIARELDIPESTVRYRVDRLRDKGVITSFMALLDPRKIGLNIIAIALIKVEANQLAEASEVLATFDESHHLFRSTGSFDLVSVVHARDIGHLDDLIERIKRIPGVREASVEVATYLVKVEPRYKLR